MTFIPVTGQDAATYKISTTTGQGAGEVLQVQSMVGFPGALTDKSGTLTLGGTAQVAVALNATRRYLYIQNLSDTEVLWIDFTATAVASQPSMRIDPGGDRTWEGSFIPTQALSIIAATTAHPWAAKEG